MTTKQAAASAVDAIDAALAENDATQPASVPTPRKATARKTSSPRKAAEPPAVEVDETAHVAPQSDSYKMKAFSTRDVPWGKLGVIKDGAATAAEAAKQGGLDFEVELLEAGFRSSVPAKPGTSPWKVVGHRRACVRKDTQTFLSYVSSTYPPVQYSEAFAFMDEISPNYVAAGCLGGGRQGFMVVQLPDHLKHEIKLGKNTESFDWYVVFRTSHDLTRAIEVSVMMLRDKCMNALTLSSFTAQAPQRWSVKHVGKDPMLKLAAATETLTRSSAYVEAFTRAVKSLAETKVELEEAESVLKRILPNRPKRDEQVSSIISAWRESPTNGFPNDGWGLVNAVDEYFEWGRPDGTRTDASRFTGALNGQTHKYTNRTAQLLLQRRR